MVHFVCCVYRQQYDDAILRVINWLSVVRNVFSDEFYLYDFYCDQFLSRECLRQHTVISRLYYVCWSYLTRFITIRLRARQVLIIDLHKG